MLQDNGKQWGKTFAASLNILHHHFDFLIAINTPAGRLLHEHRSIIVFFTTIYHYTRHCGIMICATVFTESHSVEDVDLGCLLMLEASGQHPKLACGSHVVFDCQRSILITWNNPDVAIRSYLSPLSHRFLTARTMYWFFFILLSIDRSFVNITQTQAYNSSVCIRNIFNNIHFISIKIIWPTSQVLNDLSHTCHGESTVQ